jgi:hypothetical protein
MSQATVVCLLGMHRSGTSLITRLVNLLGVALGPPERMIRALPENPKGFWEHRQLTELNDEILRKRGGSWYDPPSFAPGWELAAEFAEIGQRARAVVERDFRGEDLWGWKDPRTSLTLPFWRRLFEPRCYIVCLRSPLSVARSLERRNHLPVDKGVRLWLKYTAAALENTAGSRRLLVCYEDVLADWQSQLRRLARFLGQPEAAEQLEVQRQVQETVDLTLQNNPATLLATADDPLIAFPAKALYLVLRAFNDGRGTEANADQAPGRQVDEVLDTFTACCRQALEEAEGMQATMQERDRALQRLLTRLAENDEAMQRLQHQLRQEQSREPQRAGDVMEPPAQQPGFEALQALLLASQERLAQQTADRDRELQALRQQVLVANEVLARQAVAKEQAETERAVEVRRREQAVQELEARRNSERGAAAHVLQEAQALAATRQREVQELKARYQGEQKRWAEHLTERECLTEELQRGIQELEQALQGLRTQFRAEQNRLAEQVTEKESSLQSLQARLADKEQASQQLQEQLRQEQVRSAEREHAIAQLRQHLQQEQARAAEREQDVEQLRRQLEEEQARQVATPPENGQPPQESLLTEQEPSATPPASDEKPADEEVLANGADGPSRQVDTVPGPNGKAEEPTEHGRFPLVHGAAAVEVPSPTSAGPESPGHHEIAGPRTVEGWAWDPAQPDTPLRVNIYVDDTLLAIVVADRFRPDLMQAGKGNGRHGFIYPLPAHLPGAAPQLIRVTISGTGAPLRDTPKRLPEMVAPARAP